MVPLSSELSYTGEKGESSVSFLEEECGCRAVCGTESEGHIGEDIGALGFSAPRGRCRWARRGLFGDVGGERGLADGGGVVRVFWLPMSRVWLVMLRRGAM
jgi:hypothetical protein